MKRTNRHFWLLLLVAAISFAGQGLFAEPKKPAASPRLGYLFPAGGRVGSTFRMLVAGQNIRGATGAVFTGSGIGAKVIGEYQAFPNFDKDQNQVIRRTIQVRRAEMTGKPVPPMRASADSVESEEVKLPENPFVESLAQMSSEDLDHFEALYFGVGKQVQRSPQLSQLVMLEIGVAPDAAPGRREFRMMTRRGLSSPLGFEIGPFPEVCFPQVPGPGAASVTPRYLELPVTINGQLLPGQTMKFQFRGRKGMRFVARLQARSLIPYIADAVPGWFQPVMSLRNDEGQEIAFDDDHLLQPDPILYAMLPAEGGYTVEIRDALYRGRQDFVFRATLGDLPLVGGLFPPGGREGKEARVRVIGSGLPVTELRLDTSPGDSALRSAPIPGTSGLEIGYCVGPWPEVNATAGKELEVTLPVTVNGILDKAPAQVVRFSANAKQALGIEVIARRLGSPLDASIELIGPDGKRLAAADDANEKEGDLFLGSGLLTHHADPMLETTTERAGVHKLLIRDVSGKGGPLHIYRVEIAPRRPRFDLVVGPSALNFGPSGRVPVTVRAFRRGGFDGPIRLNVAPEGYRLVASEIPGDKNRIDTEIVREGRPSREPIRMELTGTGAVEGGTVAAKAVPVDDSMQAFLWRHLVPAQELLASFAPGADKERPDKKQKPAQKQAVPGKADEKTPGTPGPPKPTPGGTPESARKPATTDLPQAPEKK